MFLMHKSINRRILINTAIYFQVPQQTRVLQNKAFSPKHTMPLLYKPVEPEPLNDTLSSSDSEDETVHK